MNTEIRNISKVPEITYRPKAIFLLDAVACHPFSMERLHRPLPQERVEGAVILQSQTVERSETAAWPYLTAMRLLT